MFRHVVIFSWSPEAGPDQRAAAVAALRKWGVTAAEFGRLTVGEDAGLAAGNGDVVVVVDLPDRATYAAYAADARHQVMVRDHVRPILAGRSAVQYEY